MDQDLVDKIIALDISGIDVGIAELLSHYPDDIETLISGEMPYNLAYKIGTEGAAIISQNIDKFSQLKL